MSYNYNKRKKGKKLNSDAMLASFKESVDEFFQKYDTYQNQGKKWKSFCDICAIAGSIFSVAALAIAILAFLQAEKINDFTVKNSNLNYNISCENSAYFAAIESSVPYSLKPFIFEVTKDTISGEISNLYISQIENGVPNIVELPLTKVDNQDAGDTYSSVEGDEINVESLIGDIGQYNYGPLHLKNYETLENSHKYEINLGAPLNKIKEYGLHPWGTFHFVLKGFDGDIICLSFVYVYSSETTTIDNIIGGDIIVSKSINNVSLYDFDVMYPVIKELHKIGIDISFEEFITTIANERETIISKIKK